MYPDSLLSSIEKICRTAGEFQLRYFREVSGEHISDKGLNQLVSFVDVETEKMLVSSLHELIPEAGFITEENTSEMTNDSSLQWIIDPLDGTTNFLHGLGAFSISVALYRGNTGVAGVVYLPLWNEMFSAEAGKGATLNGEKMLVSETADLYHSLLATGFPYTEFRNMQSYLAILREYMQKTRGLRRMGSAAIDLAYTACGRFEGFFEFGLNSWDVAAGILLVQEAGGTVSAFQKQINPVFGGQILATNGKVHTQMQSIIETYLV